MAYKNRKPGNPKIPHLEEEQYQKNPISRLLAKNPRKSSKFLDLCVSSPPQYLADQSTIFQPWGQILPTLNYWPPKFFHLPLSLH